MIIDGLLRLSSDQALTSTGDTASTNVIDLQNARDLGSPDPQALQVAVFVSTAFTSGGAGTLQVIFQGSDDNSNWDDYVSSPVYTVAQLAAGASLANFAVPGVPPGRDLPRYWRLRYAIATAAMTGGTVTADLVVNREQRRAYPAGINISN